MAQINESEKNKQTDRRNTNVEFLGNKFFLISNGRNEHFNSANHPDITFWDIHVFSVYLHICYELTQLIWWKNFDPKLYKCVSVCAESSFISLINPKLLLRYRMWHSTDYPRRYTEYILNTKKNKNYEYLWIDILSYLFDTNNVNWFASKHSAK